MGSIDPIGKYFVEAIVDLRRRQLWREFDPRSAFMIRHPDEPHAMAAAMPNKDDKAFVFLMYRGSVAFSDLVAKGLRDVSEDALELDDPTSVLGVGFATMRDLLPSERRMIRDAHFRAGPDGLVPFAFSRPSRRFGKVPSRLELRVIADCARAILATHAAGEFRPERLDLENPQILEVAIELREGSLIARAGLVQRPMYLEASTLRRRRGDEPPPSSNGSHAT